jgi:hypothetical protein
LGLTIKGSALEPVLAEFEQELERAGITRVRPDFYFSTEWGVPFNSISIGIPFYLARPELIEVHAGHGEYLEGVGKEQLMRFLRHEMGHVMNYAYRLYEREDWVKQFGSMTQPYVEEYRPEPFSRRHVRHLPGWYAQKHPDEDWAETFAVWMTPNADWRAAYRDSPQALAKLKYCDRLIRELKDEDPLTTAIDHDEDASELQSSLEEFYRKAMSAGESPLPPGLDGALQAMFEDHGARGAQSTESEVRPADKLIRRIERDLMTDVYTWTGHFPEDTRRLVRHLARRAKELGQCYRADRELDVVIAFTTLVTSLAMNHVLKGHYLP